MLATRELDQSKIPPKAQTWINKCLKYTHGYGLHRLCFAVRLNDIRILLSGAIRKRFKTIVV